MRISTSLMFESGSQQISRRQADLFATQSQISTGRKIMRPSDDPVGASEALRVSQSKALSDQWQTNQSAAREKLQLTESKLNDVGGVLQEARTLLVQAGGGTLTNEDRTSLASALSGLRDELLAISNSRDGTDGFLFAGYRIGTQPFSQSPGGVTYVGDEGQRTIEVLPGHEMAVSVDGASLFERVRTGNGTFTTSPAVANTGTGVASAGSVYDNTLLDANTYQVTFTVTGTGPTAVTTYDVLNVTTGTPVSANNAWTAGQSIRVAGRQFEVTGAPATGDQFSTAPSANQSLFDSFDAAIAALRLPVTKPVDSAAYRNALIAADANFARGMDNMLEERTSAGARLAELDGLTTGSSAESLLHAQRLSALQDLDYAEAASRFSAQSLALQAAQQTYQRVSQLSLFNYLT